MLELETEILEVPLSEQEQNEIARIQQLETLRNNLLNEIERAKTENLPYLYYVQSDRQAFLMKIEEKFLGETREILESGLVTTKHLIDFREQDLKNIEKIVYALKLTFIDQNNLRKGFELIKDEALISIINFGQTGIDIDNLAQKISAWVAYYGKDNHHNGINAQLVYELTDLSNAKLWHVSDKGIAFKDTQGFIEEECCDYIRNEADRKLYIHLLELQLVLSDIFPFKNSKHKRFLFKGNDWLLFQNCFNNVKAEGTSPLEWVVKAFFNKK
jgi:hypothetical protein